MSYLLPTLCTKREVDKVIRETEDLVLVLRFGRDTDSSCLQLDDITNPMPLYTDDQLSAALEAKSNGMSYREVRERFGIPPATLCDYRMKRSSQGVKAGRKTTFAHDVEKQMVDAMIHSAKMGFPLTKVMALEKVGRLAHKTNCQNQFVDGIPSDKYWRCLKKRFPQLTTRNPECCSRIRLEALSKDRVAAYFNDVHRLIEEGNIQPEAIWNMDETGLQFIHKPSKVVAAKGQRTLYAKSSQSKETVTVVATINAAGTAMPPLCIVKGVTVKALETFATYLGPSDARWTNQRKGWMENTLGVEWFKEVFLMNCGSLRPQLLLMEGHSSHEVLEMLQLAVKENIHILALPPHTTQVLQPLDKVVFKPFKASYNKACSRFLYENPTKVIDKRSFPFVLAKAWEVMKEQALLKKAFKSTGVCPPNPLAISDEYTLPSEALRLATGGLELIANACQMAESNPGPSPSTSTLDAPDLSFSTSSSDDIVAQACQMSGIFTQADISFSDLGDVSLNGPSHPIQATSPIFTQADISFSDLGDVSLNGPSHPIQATSVTGDIFTVQELSFSEMEVADTMSSFPMVHADWNDAITEIFSISAPEEEQQSKKRPASTHRILTSDKIIKLKEEKDKKKEEEEFNRLKRKLLREQKKQNKLDEKRMKEQGKKLSLKSTQLKENL